MHLSKRLQAIYNMVNSPCILADIGCDHALLSIALVRDHKVTRAYACDVHKGPLQRACEAIEDANLEHLIEPILSDGLHQVKDDVTCIVIAGMGWETIVSILEQGESKAKKCKQIILQSNNHVDDLRRWLVTHGYCIDAEDIVKERHYYQVLSIHPGIQSLTDDECLFGLTLEKHPLFKEYWQHVATKKKAILKRTNPNHDAHQEAANCIQKIEQKLKEQ